jgi:hypothetical protein
MDKEYNIPELYDKYGLKYEMNYDEICSLLLKRIKKDPNFNNYVRADLIDKLGWIHDTLIDETW